MFIVSIFKVKISIGDNLKIKFFFRFAIKNLFFLIVSFSSKKRTLIKFSLLNVYEAPSFFFIPIFIVIYGKRKALVSRKLFFYLNFKDTSGFLISRPNFCRGSYVTQKYFVSLKIVYGLKEF